MREEKVEYIWTLVETARVAALPWRYRTVGYAFKATGMRDSASRALVAIGSMLDLKNGSANVNHEPRVTLSVLVSIKFTVLRAMLAISAQWTYG